MQICSTLAASIANAFGSPCVSLIACMPCIARSWGHSSHSHSDGTRARGRAGGRAVGRACGRAGAGWAGGCGCGWVCARCWVGGCVVCVCVCVCVRVRHPIHSSIPCKNCIPLIRNPSRQSVQPARRTARPARGARKILKNWRGGKLIWHTFSALMKLAIMLWAMARASKVLPVPGGP